MAEWNREKVNPSDLNNGNEWKQGDRVAREELNAMVNAGLYAQDFAEHLADTPDTSDAGSIGTPSVTLIDNVVNGITYKKFKFSNLKGEKGDKGDTGLPGGSNPNLLINGDFKVNQRDSSSYTGNTSSIVYCVDRWNFFYSNFTFTPSTKTLSFSDNGSFVQFIEDTPSLLGKTLTLSAKIDGVIYNGSATLNSSYSSTTYIIDVSISLGKLQLVYDSNRNLLKAQLAFSNITSQQTLVIDYIKLEVGSVATPFSPRPYAEELALCQRHYPKYSPSNSDAMIGTGIVFSSSKIIIGVSLPVTLRTVPTLTVNGNFCVKTTSATYTTNDNALTLTPAGLCNNVLQIEITSANTSFTSGDCAVLRVSENTAYLEIDAEIY